MLIVGLGNPGLKYGHTVHNIGFDVIDKVCDLLGMKLKNKGCGAVYADAYIDGVRVVLAQPQTYMNLSGESVVALAAHFHFDASQCLIVCDDIDLPVGTLRLRKEGSGGTHNGLRNIVDKLGTRNFPRLRVGAGSDRGRLELKDYVLSRPRGDDGDALRDAIDRAAECVAEFAHGVEADVLMQRYNVRDKSND